MSLLRKIEVTEGVATVAFDLYAIYSPAFATRVVDTIYDYIPLPEGTGPFGMDYKMITRVALLGGSLVLGLVALLNKDEKSGDKN